MHRTLFLRSCLLFVLALASAAWAGEAAPVSAPAVSEADRTGIHQAALDYAEGWYEGDAARMERALHPDLAKRVVVTDANGKARLDHMGALRLVQGVRAGHGKATPKEKQRKDITIFDVQGNAATVKLVMADWTDFLHIAKLNGKWVIVNVLWELAPRP